MGESRKGVKKMQVLSKGNRYSPEFKADVTLESFQRDTTIEAVRERYGVSKSVINKWRKTFKANLPLVFSLGQNQKQQPKLRDNSVVRGCFAERKSTRQVLSLVFSYGLGAELVEATLKGAKALKVGTYIWHSDQGKQYGAKTVENKALSL